MAAYRRVYDSRHLQADCQEPGHQLRDPTLGNRVWATFTFLHSTLCMDVYNNSNNNSHDNVYGAVVMTKVIARVHPVNVD